MAYIDEYLELSDSQALTATALSTNVIDLGLTRAIGNGEAMVVVFTVEVAADQTSADEDYTFALEVASNATITANRQEIGQLVFESGTPTAPALNADLLVAGFQFAIAVPPSAISIGNRYLAARYTLAGTTPTITVSADLRPAYDVSIPVTYASGFTVS